MDSSRFVLLFLISIAFLMSIEANDGNGVTTNDVNVTTNDANFNPNDYVWQKRAEKAKQAAQEAYHPNPREVADHLNKHVHRSMSGNNNTATSRRTLRDGACLATNPIDQCWRCKSDWNENRKQLAECVLGFGRKTTGGKAGSFYVVTDPSDSDLVNPTPGTLRHAVIQTEPLWITFKSSMFIKLNGELIMTSNKTIDGRGVQVHITGGAGLTLQFISNVIIHNIKIYDIKVANGGLIRDSLTHFGQRGYTDGDAINMFGATNIWLDHLSLSNCYDGLIDAVESSTAITISNCHFTRHNDVLLFGAKDTYSADKIMQITLAFNHFGRGLIQRMPRVRWGFAHIVNNDYTRWEMYAIGGSQDPTILSQGNYFMAPENRNAKEVTKREYTEESVWKSWVWKSEEDVLANGAVFVESGDKNHKFDLGEDMIAPKSGKFAKELAQFAGHLKCVPGSPC